MDIYSNWVILESFFFKNKKTIWDVYVVIKKRILPYGKLNTQIHIF